MEEKKLHSSSLMAELDFTIHPTKHQPPKVHQNPSKPFPSILYRLILVSVLIALLPIFPSSQSPELSDKSIIARGWELLHLLVVGVAISYGLFSRRNPDPEIEKEALVKADTPQSYVSQILQVSSVFDDEEVESPKGLDFDGGSKNQTWNYSQYYREEPVIMVAKETADGNNSSTKPLYLPARSLKSTFQYPEPFDSGGEIDGACFTTNEMDDVGDTGRNRGREGVVLPSPIPWVSRSRRFQVNEELSPPNSPLKYAFDTELAPSRTPSFRSPTSRDTSTTPSPKRLSPSPSLPPEVRGKTNEDLRRKRSFHKSSPPPPPPPPPLPFSYASRFTSDKRDAGKSFKDELKDLSRREKRDGFIQRDDVGSESSNSEKGSYTGRSVRTVRSKEVQNLPPLRRNHRKKKDEFMEKMIISATDSESDDDNNSELSDAEEKPNPVTAEANPEENEVDKKADEFIAKFREQIRLQRIASIKKSSGQRSTRSSK